MMARIIAMSCIGYVLLLASLLFAPFLLRVVAAQASSATIVAIEPRDSSADVTGTLIVNITIVDVQNLYGVGITFMWNSSVLRALNVDDQLGQAEGVLHNPVFVAENSLREGKYVLSATSVNPAPSFNGTGTIAVMTFNVVNLGESSLDLQSELYDRPLPDMPSMPIDHTTVGGYFHGPIPEFPSFALLPSFMTLSLFVTIFFRKISGRPFIRDNDHVVRHSKQNLLIDTKATEYWLDRMNRKIIVVAALLIVIAVVLTFLLVNETASLARIYVDPQTTEKATGQNFTVNISISDITNLYGWEFKLGWNLTILDLVNATEGTFLKSVGPTFFTYTMNVTGNYVLVDCTLLGNMAGANGNGVLASIQFHVKESGACDLNLYETKLEDPSEEMLTHTTNVGRLTANP